MKVQGNIDHNIKADKATVIRAGLVFLAVNLVLVFVSGLVRIKLAGK